MAAIRGQGSRVTFGAIVKYAILAAFLWLIGCFILWLTMPTAHYRYRLTVEINTPTGIRSASAVHGVTWGYYSGVITSFIGRVWGEAIFVDLGAGPDGRPRHVIALLPSERLVPQVFENRFREQDYQKYATIPGVHTVTDGRLVTLVTFSDLTDPKSIEIVFGRTGRASERFGPGPDDVRHIDRIAQSFGKEYSLRHITVEMVSSGMWPFNQLVLDWPVALFGTPITDGLRKNIPFLRDESTMSGMRYITNDSLPFIWQFVRK